MIYHVPVMHDEDPRPPDVREWSKWIPSKRMEWDGVPFWTFPGIEFECPEGGLDDALDLLRRRIRHRHEQERAHHTGPWSSRPVRREAK